MSQYKISTIVNIPSDFFFDDNTNQSYPCEIVSKSEFKEDGEGGNWNDNCYVVRRLSDGLELPAVCTDFMF